jgi:uncharacterized membrane protein
LRHLPKQLETRISLSGYDLTVLAKDHLRRLRRFLALVCLAAILLAALSPITPGVLFAFQIPIWFFFAAVIGISAASVEEVSASPLFAFLPVFSPRPPPLR